MVNYNLPIESVEFQNFYEIPGFSNYVISRKGVVLNKTKKSELLGSINPVGYVNFRLTGDSGFVLTWGRHRLLSYVFKYPGDDYPALVVNHKDGIKGNDDLSNLEWTTYQGNIEHAGKNNLTTKCCMVSVRLIDSGDILKFPSIIKCAKYFNMSKDAIMYRLKIGESRVFPERRQYRFGHDDTEWYIPASVDFAILKNGRNKEILLRDIRTKTITPFNKLTDLAEYLNKSISAITKMVKTRRDRLFCGFYQLKFIDDDYEWKDIDDPYLELDKYSKRVIIVYDNSSKTRKVYLSATECAKDCCLLPTTLNWRLKNSPNKIYSDGKSYSYYSNNIRSY